MRPGKSDRPSREGRNIVSYNESNSEDEYKDEGYELNAASADDIKRCKDDVSELPPEFRSAGLTAQMEIPCRKVFGPFSGVISESSVPPKSSFTFICQVRNSDSQTFANFYTNKSEKHKCDWLKMIKPPFGNKLNNIVAYNSSNGVCYEAVKDISIGEELLALFSEKKSSVDSKRIATTSRRKRPSVILLTSSVRNSNEPNEEDNNGQKVARKRERSRKGAPKRVVENIVDLEDNQEDSRAQEVTNLWEGVEIDAETEGLGSSEKRRNEVISANDELSQTSRNRNEYGSDREAKPTGIITSSGLTKCSCCNKEFTDYEKFEEHSNRKECNKKPGIQCDECCSVLRTKKSLKRHILNTHTQHRCETCHEIFQSNQDLQKHCRDTHMTEEDLYKICEICEKRFAKSYMAEHIKSHNDAFRCKICQKTFSCGSNLRKHTKKHRPGYKPKKQVWNAKKIKCGQCDKILRGSNALKAHIRLHTGERPFKCGKCDWAFVQRAHLIRHKKVQHGEGNHTEKFQCNTCSRWYSTEAILKMHINTIHKGLRPFKCNMCKDTFNIQGLLLRHQRELHQMDVDLPEEQRRYVCKFEDCGKKFSLQSDLNKHIYEHTGVHPYQCKECGNCFSSSGNLGKHVRRIHRGQAINESKGSGCQRKYQCNLCDKLFSNAASLREHERVHTGERIRCSKCPSTFVQRSGLRKHLRCLRCPGLRKELEEKGESPQPRVYKKARTWKCDDCNKCFSGPSDLRAHRRVHTGERPYNCEVCGKSFTQPGNLTKHEKYVHGGEQRPKDQRKEKRYACSLCCKSFLTPADLSMHCRTHTGLKPFECTHCGMAFTQKGNLKKHVARWHTLNAPTIRRKASPRENQEERVVIKGLESSNQTADNRMMTCSVVIPPSFITNNKEVVITNVPVSMAAMLKQKATEVAKSNEPSSVSLASLIQCLTESQKEVTASALKAAADESAEKPMPKGHKVLDESHSKVTTSTTVMQTDDSIVSSSFQDTLTKLNVLPPAKQSFPPLTIPPVSNFMRLSSDAHPISAAPSYPIEMMKSFLSPKSTTGTENKQSSSLFSEQPSTTTATPEATKDIHRVHDILVSSSLIEISAQRSTAPSGLNFSGDFTGQVRGLEFTQADSSRFRFPFRNPINRFQPESPKGLQLPFDGQLTTASFLSSQRLTHPDFSRQTRAPRREIFHNILAPSQSEYPATSSQQILHQSFSNVTFSQHLGNVNNYFQSPGKVIHPQWDPSGVRDNGMREGEHQLSTFMAPKPFQIIGSGLSDARK